MHGRRKFIQRLGAALSAPFLQGVGLNLINEAYAAERRRIAVFVITGESMSAAQPLGYTPQGFDPGMRAGNSTKWSAAQGPLTLPSMFEALRPFLPRIAMVDGLYCMTTGEVAHGTGYSFLSGLPTSGADPSRPAARPTGMTIDHHIARVTGQNTRLRAIHCGMSGGKLVDEMSSTFAAGPDQPVVHVASPTVLRSRLTGMSAGPAMPASPGASALEKGLLDSLRDDIRRLRGELAGTERQRLDSYLEIVDDYDRKQASAAAAPANCQNVPAAEEGEAAARTRSLFRLATLALRCGVTNVFGMTLGLGWGHDDLAIFSPLMGGKYDGHLEGEAYMKQVFPFFKFVGDQMAELLTALGPLANDAVLLFANGHGATMKDHHNAHGSAGAPERVPTLVFDGTGTMKPGGRYIRYARGERSFMDLLCSVAHAAGAPTDTFGAAGKNRVMGPLPELMA